MARRILLSGAGGFVGHHTLEHLLINTNWEIVCTDSFRHAGKTDRISEVLDKNEQWWGRTFVVTHDLTVPFSDQLAYKIGPIDAIISMASESHVDRSITHPVPFIKNNVDLVLNLLEYQREYAPNAIFLQVSTDEVYGPAPEGHNHREWEPILPSNPYSASKAAQEAICFSYWRTYDIPMIITNTMNIIGERQDSEKFMPMVLKKVLSGEVMPIHASPEGEAGSRYYLHARNQADALMYLLKYYLNEDYASGEWTTEGTLKHSQGSSVPPRYNIVGEREVNNLEMAQMIAEYTGKELKYELVNFHESRPGHDLRYALDGFKLAAMGWKAPFSLEESLKHTVEWTMNHREWLA